jgi:hypothetical protein
LTRAEALVLLHVLLAMTLVGALLTAAVVSAACGRTATGPSRRLVWHSTLLAVAAAFATIVVGEATRAREHVDGSWLDVASGLAYIGLLFPGVALAVLGRLALDRQRLMPWITGLALAMVAVALATAFLMTAKPA